MNIYWKYIYNISYSGVLIAPDNIITEVDSIEELVDPGPPPNINDTCGRSITPVLVGYIDNPDPIVESGTRIYTYRYTSYDGSETVDWTYTYNKIDISIINPIDWANEIELTIDSSKIDSDLTDFPVTISVSSSTGLTSVDITDVFDKLMSDDNRKKIAISDFEYHQLYCEIENWDSINSIAVLHVKVPLISSSEDTIIRLFYDPTHSDNDIYIGDTGDSTAQLVWDDNFILVSHFNQDPTTESILDSTINELHGIPTTSITSTDGIIGKALVFNGTTIQVVDYGDNSILNRNGALTVEAVTLYNCIENRGTIFQCGNTDYGNTLLRYTTSDISSCLEFNANYNNTQNYAVKPVNFSGNNHHFVGTFEITPTKKIYVDGVLQSTSWSGSGSRVHDFYRARLGGGDVANSNSISMTISEFRFSSVARSAAWIKATYYSLWDQLITVS